MSQSTQLPWRRRCTLDLLFHCEGRPGVILGSPIELTYMMCDAMFLTGYDLIQLSSMHRY